MTDLHHSFFQGEVSQAATSLPAGHCGFHNDPVSNHFIVEHAIATVLCEGVESRDKGVNGLTLFLSAHIELGTLEDNINFCLFVK